MTQSQGICNDCIDHPSDDDDGGQEKKKEEVPWKCGTMACKGIIPGNKGKGCASCYMDLCLDHCMSEGKAVCKECINQRSDDDDDVVVIEEEAKAPLLERAQATAAYAINHEIPVGYHVHTNGRMDGLCKNEGCDLCPTDIDNCTLRYFA